MKQILFFILLAFITNVMFVALLYGLYFPGLTRFENLECSTINNTNSKTTINCQKIIFDKNINGPCFFDKKSQTIVKFDIKWLNLIIITGTIAGVSIFILLIHVLKIIVNKIKKPV